MGTVYLIPTTDLNFNSTSTVTPVSNLDSNQRSAYNELLSSGFHAYSRYYVSQDSYFPDHYLLYKTGTVFYYAYYLKDNGYIAYLRLKTTPSWYYSLDLHDGGVIVTNAGVWNDSNIGVIVENTQNIPVANILVDYFADRNSAYSAISAYLPQPITYYLTNCSAPTAPASVAPGDVVSFPVTVQPGYNIFNPVQGGSISIYQGNNYIPFTFENGVIRFTAPGGD